MGRPKIYKNTEISIHAPREGSDGVQLCGPNVLHYFYPRSPRGERPWPVDSVLTPRIFLSTLPARGATLAQPDQQTAGAEFLSTLPARGATGSPAKRSPLMVFLSTLPARGATASRGRSVPAGWHFYPRSPRGERRGSPLPCLLSQNISIHAPREGSDGQSASAVVDTAAISIHAPREGSDAAQQLLPIVDDDFYPRSPRGERRGAESRRP